MEMPALVAIGLEIHPIETFGRQAFRTGTNAFGGRFRPRAIDTTGAGNQTSNRFAVSRDHDFFTLLYAVQ